MTRSNKISLVGSEAIRAIQFIQLVIHSTETKKNKSMYCTVECVYLTRLRLRYANSNETRLH